MHKSLPLGTRDLCTRTHTRKHERRHTRKSSQSVLTHTHKKGTVAYTLDATHVKHKHIHTKLWYIHAHAYSATHTRAKPQAASHMSRHCWCDTICVFSSVHQDLYVNVVSWTPCCIQSVIYDYVNVFVLHTYCVLVCNIFVCMTVDACMCVKRCMWPRVESGVTVAGVGDVKCVAVCAQILCAFVLYTIAIV